MSINIEEIEFKVGQSYRASLPNLLEPRKVHIIYVLPSKAYRNRTLIVYKFYGKHRQWWHEVMCRKTEMEFYIWEAKQYEK